MLFSLSLSSLFLSLTVTSVAVASSTCVSVITLTLVSLDSFLPLSLVSFNEKQFWRFFFHLNFSSWISFFPFFYFVQFWFKVVLCGGIFLIVFFYSCCCCYWCHFYNCWCCCCYCCCLLFRGHQFVPGWPLRLCFLLQHRKSETEKRKFVGLTSE